MKNLTVAALLVMFLAPALAVAQPNWEYIPFNSLGYQYQFVKSTDGKVNSFSDPSKKDSDIGGWATTPAGQGAWGTLNKPGTDPCPLNISKNIKVTWPSGRDVLIRRWINAADLAGASNVRITVALDNAVIVYWNNKPVFLNGTPAGKFTHDVCAAAMPGTTNPAGDVTFTIPDDYLKSTVSTNNGVPQYLLAVRGVTLAEKSYIDIKVVVDKGYKLTTLTSGPGTIAVSPVKEYYQPTDQITLKAAVTQAGYFFGRGTDPASLQTGWVGVPFPSADKFANPVTFSISQNTTVTAYFSPLPAPQTFTVGSAEDLSSTGATIEGSLRWAIENADRFPGQDLIVFSPLVSGGSIKLDKPLSASDLVIINPTGGLITLEPENRTSFGTGDAFELPGVFVNWGYASGGITLRGLKIRNFAGPGICINSNGNTIQGCEITGNGGDGICIEDGNNNLIGGTTSLQGNRIYDNGGRGVSVRAISSADAIPPPSANTIQGNSIYRNGGLGIDLADRDGNFGVTMNRYLNLPPYSTSGLGWGDFVNRAQHYPEIESADPLTGLVKCRLYAPAEKTFRIEIFRNWTPGPDGDKQLLIATGSASTYQAEVGTGNGIYSFEITSPQSILLGDVISATATDGDGNTSEFSPTIYAGIKTRVYGPVVQAGSPTNRWVANTTFRGVPLHWANGKAVFAVEADFFSPPAFPAPSDGSDPVNAAINAWNFPASPLAVSKSGNPGPSEAGGGIPDGVNNVVWTTDFVSKTGPEFENALAISRVRYNSFTGEIFDADVLINGALVNASHEYDLTAVLTHEIGHAGGGLGDIYDRNDQPYNLFMGTNPAKGDVTMYGIVKELDTYQTTVHEDDQAGLNYIFGNVLPSNIDLALVIDASQTYASYGAFSPSIGAAMEIVDKLRVGDGVSVVRFPGSDAGSASSIPVPFQRIGSGDPQGQKDDIKRVIANMLASADDRRPIGAALTAAAGALPATNQGRRGVVLLSAGNETETPTALDPGVLQQLVGSNPIPVFTMGFAQSQEGANLGSKLADATGGLFYEADNTSISPNANHAWEVLTGQQLVLEKVATSGGDNLAISYKGSPTYQAISWKGATNTAISWKGNTSAAFSGSVDEGTTGLYPAISWKGNTSAAKLSAAAAAGGAKFFLGLITPDFVGDWTDFRWDLIQSDANLPQGILSPDNGTVGSLKKLSGVEYVQGETYAFYRITAGYPGKRDGNWVLIPLGANGEDAPYPSQPVTVNGRFATLTDVVMDVEFNKSNYLPGDPATITVSLFEGGQVQASHTVGGGPIIGAASGIKAVVTLPNGTAQQVAFTEVGNGVYTTTFANTSAKGSYEFVVTAQGTAPVSGDKYFRKYDQSIYVAPAYASASLFARNSVTMLDGSKIITGDVLVNEPVPEGSAAVSLLVGLGASTPGGYVLKADKIQVLAGATVASTIFTTSAPLNAGTITGTINTGYPPGQTGYATFPPFEDAAGDLTGDISVATSGTLTISPSYTGGPSFGNVLLQPGAILTLEPGEYDFKSLRLKSGSQLWVKGAIKLRIRTGIHADNGSYVGTMPDLSVSPGNILVYVQGTNSQGPGSYSVDISPKSKLLVSLYAPNGTIYLNQETQAAGAFFGRDIVLGQLTTVRLSSGFAILAKSAAGEHSAGPADESSVPQTYELLQNYPNPFNPTTQIKYALPAAGPVNLTIYNMLGQEVARLVDEVQPEGYHVVEWNGRNHLGTVVGSGMYIFQLRAGDFVQTRKMMLLK